MAHADDPAERYRKARARLDEARDAGDVSDADHDAITTFLDAKDDRKKAVPAPESGTAALRSLESYCRRLEAAAGERELSGLDTDGVNRLIDDLRTGGTTVGPADGYADGSMQAFSGALSGFYAVNEELGVDPDDVVSVSGGDPAIDSRSVLQREEIQELRGAITNARDRALFELLAFTMQRIRAIQTLRVKDIDLENGEFYLNTDANGLKGAAGKRPLLGAEGPVRQWLEYHPTDDPDDALITVLPGAQNGEAGEPLTQAHMNRRLRAIRDRTDVEKPTNAHAFRHYGVTVARAVYDLSWDEIAFMGGWASPETPKRIYEHLTDEEFIRKIKVAFGEEEPDDGEDPEDIICTSCGFPLPPDSKACNNCGATIRADAVSVLEEFEEGATERAVEVESEIEAQAVRAVLREVRENPERFTD